MPLPIPAHDFAIPAQAGIQPGLMTTVSRAKPAVVRLRREGLVNWIPAFAGMAKGAGMGKFAGMRKSAGTAK
jgi:hypothetical protein